MPPPVVRWTFSDSVLSTSYTFTCNPSDGGSPVYQKNLSEQVTTAPDGAVLLFEGKAAPKHGSISGTILDLAQYQAMVTWFNKRYVITMTDDLGRSQDIYITKFEPRRVRAATSPYKHSFTLDFVIVSYTDL